MIKTRRIVKANKQKKRRNFSLQDRLIMVVGNYGSGKTEVSVNLAIYLAKMGYNVQIGDLDIVNPYFRCREARERLRENNIRVVIPPASQTWADLPIVVPEIKGMLHPSEEKVSIFDVGGDGVGAKLLSGFVEFLSDAPYALWQVINARRPFTDTVAGCLNMQKSIEESSRLRVNGLVVNTHLMDETTPEVILEGVELAKKLSEENGVPIKFVAVMQEFLKSKKIAEIDLPKIGLLRYLAPPWVRPKPDEPELSQNQKDSLPAKRSVPIGRA